MRVKHDFTNNPATGLSEAKGTSNCILTRNEELTTRKGRFSFTQLTKLSTNTLAFLFFSVAPLTAQVTAPLSEFDKQVRATLLAHPEIILEVFELLERQVDAKNSPNADLPLIASNFPSLFGEAPVGLPVIAEFVDYNCGYCRSAHKTTLAFKADHPETTINVIQFPILGEGSNLAARVALAIKKYDGMEKYIRLHEKLMATDTRIDHWFLTSLLSDLGYDAETVLKLAEEEQFKTEINHHHALAKRLNIQGTPGFVGPSGILRGVADETALLRISQNINSTEGE